MIIGGESCRLLLGGQLSARRCHEPLGVGSGWINGLQLFADPDHGRPLSGSVQPLSLSLQGDKLVLLAGLCQPAIGISIVRVGLGNHGVFGDRLLPIPGIGSRRRLRVVAGQFLLAARHLQLSGSVGIARPATKNLAEQVDGLIPLLSPKCGQRPVVELLHLRSCNVLVPAIGFVVRNLQFCQRLAHSGYQPPGVERDAG